MVELGAVTVYTDVTATRAPPAGSRSSLKIFPRLVEVRHPGVRKVERANDSDGPVGVRGPRLLLVGQRELEPERTYLVGAKFLIIIRLTAKAPLDMVFPV